MKEEYSDSNLCVQSMNVDDPREEQILRALYSHRWPFSYDYEDYSDCMIVLLKDDKIDPICEAYEDEFLVL